MVSSSRRGHVATGTNPKSPKRGAERIPMSIIHAEFGTLEDGRQVINLVCTIGPPTVSKSGNVTLATHGWAERLGSLNGVNISGQLILQAENMALTDALPQPDGTTFNVREAAKPEKGKENPYQGSNLTPDQFADTDAGNWWESLLDACDNAGTLDEPISRAKTGKSKMPPKALPRAATVTPAGVATNKTR
jgi:hypothetical protein